jgi:hypothetical protein
MEEVSNVADLDGERETGTLVSQFLADNSEMEFNIYNKLCYIPSPCMLSQYF